MKKIFWILAICAAACYHGSEIKGGERMYQYTVPLHAVAEEFHLKPLIKATDYEQIHLLVADVTRPGLEITGYYEHFEPMRLQVIGMV